MSLIDVAFCWQLNRDLIMTTSNPPITAQPEAPRIRIWARWRAAWQHPLMAIYLRLPRRTLPPGLARRSVAFVWITGLLGTALAVLLYPQATEMNCTTIYSTQYCAYSLAGQNSPLYTFDLWFSRGLSIILFVIPPVMLVGALIRNFMRGVRGVPTSQINPFSLAQGWDNGLITLLRLSPMEPDEMVRIRILSRLHSARVQWAWGGLVMGFIATLSLSHAVLLPTYGWLGGWGNWLAHIGLVGLWVLAGIAWVVVFSIFAVLNEVCFNGKTAIPGVNWTAVALIVFLFTLLFPLHIVLQLWFRIALEASLPMHQWWIILPMTLVGLGLLLSVINAVAALIVFRLRFRTRAALQF